jgi:hypothetical protein
MKTPKKAHGSGRQGRSLRATRGDESGNRTQMRYASLHRAQWQHVFVSASVWVDGAPPPADERDKFCKKYKTMLFEAYGVIQKEYVTVPQVLLRNTKELKNYPLVRD